VIADHNSQLAVLCRCSCGVPQPHDANSVTERAKLSQPTIYSCEQVTKSLG